jgi:hypothetical protein
MTFVTRFRFVTLLFTFGLLGGCDALGATDSEEDVRLHITNLSQCTLKIGLTGNVGIGDVRDDWFVPLSQERARTLAPSQVEKPLVRGTGAVTVSIVSAPAGQDVPCTAYMMLDGEGSNGRYILHERLVGNQVLAAHGMGATVFANPRSQSGATSVTIYVEYQ